MRKYLVALIGVTAVLAGCGVTPVSTGARVAASGAMAAESREAEQVAYTYVEGTITAKKAQGALWLLTVANDKGARPAPFAVDAKTHVLLPELDDHPYYPILKTGAITDLVVGAKVSTAFQGNQASFVQMLARPQKSPSPAAPTDQVVEVHRTVHRLVDRTRTSDNLGELELFCSQPYMAEVLLIKRKPFSPYAPNLIVTKAWLNGKPLNASDKARFANLLKKAQLAPGLSAARIRQIAGWLED
jgi:hypothetical protein